MARVGRPGPRAAGPSSRAAGPGLDCGAATAERPPGPGQGRAGAAGAASPYPFWPDAMRCLKKCYRNAGHHSLRIEAAPARTRPGLDCGAATAERPPGPGQGRAGAAGAASPYPFWPDGTRCLNRCYRNVGLHSVRTEAAPAAPRAHALPEPTAMVTGQMKQRLSFPEKGSPLRPRRLPGRHGARTGIERPVPLTQPGEGGAGAAGVAHQFKPIVESAAGFTI